MSTRTPTRTERASAVPLLWTALATSVVLAVAALLDGTVLGTLASHVADVYTPYGVPWRGAAVALTSSLVVLGVVGTAGWLLVARGVSRRRSWAAPGGTVLALVGLVAGLTLVLAQEYGQALVPAWLGLLALLPGVVGVVATVCLWRDRPTRSLS